MSKRHVLEWMHELVSFNVIGDKQYKSRYNGFNGELHFMQFFRETRITPSASGGVFVPLVRTDDSFNQSIYIVVTSNKNCSFIDEQLRLASNLATKGCFKATYDKDEPITNWSYIEVPSTHTPVKVHFPSSFQLSRWDNDENIDISEFFEITGFSPSFKKRATVPEPLKESFLSKFECYDYEDIVETYLTRFVLDCLCSLHGSNRNFQRGAPLDIDMFVRTTSGQWAILEIKEKDLSRNGCFGMDIRRINSLLQISQSFSMKTYYVVRHIDNQNSRSFVDWKFIDMIEFEQYANKSQIQGGHGMRKEDSDNPTLLCQLKYFKSLVKRV